MIKCCCTYKVGEVMEETKIYSQEELENAVACQIIKEVAASLKEKGYNPINQIVGYLMSGDPGYISSYKDARNKILELDRAKIVEILLKEFQKVNK